MHRFRGTTLVQYALVQYASVLFTMGRRALDNSQHKLLRRTDIVHNSALREHFPRSEDCNGSGKERCTGALTTMSPICGSVQYDTDVFSFGTRQFPPRGGGGGWTRGRCPCSLLRITAVTDIQQKDKQQHCWKILCGSLIDAHRKDNLSNSKKKFVVQRHWHCSGHRKEL